MILRSATAAGLDGVLLPRRGLPAIDPLVVKASAGVAFRAPVLRAGTAEEGCAALRDGRVRRVRAGRRRRLAAGRRRCRRGSRWCWATRPTGCRPRCAPSSTGCWPSRCTAASSRWAWRVRAPSRRSSSLAGGMPELHRHRVATWLSAGCPARRAAAAAAAGAVRPRRDRAAAAARGEHRRPADDRAPPHAAGGVRLHRRRRRRRAVAAPGRGARSPGSSSPPTVLRDVSDGRHRPRHPRASGRALPFAFAPDRLHPDDAPRPASARSRRWPSRSASRTRSRRWAPPPSRTSPRPRRRRPQVVPALPVARPCPGQGPRAARRRRPATTP